jgi:hypothetical protein
MKALDILKALDLLNKLSVNLKNRSITGRDYEVFWRGQIDEAIAELEAWQSKYDNGQLQYSKLWDMYSDLKKQLEPKSCDGCKWEFEDFRLSNGIDVCNYCAREYIDRYEPKD